MTVRLNEKEEEQFKKDLQKSGQTQSRYIKSKILSPSISRRTAVQQNGEVTRALAQLNIELKSLGVVLSPELSSRLDKVVKSYVCS